MFNINIFIDNSVYTNKFTDPFEMVANKKICYCYFNAICTRTNKLLLCCNISVTLKLIDIFMLKFVKMSVKYVYMQNVGYFS